MCGVICIRSTISDIRAELARRLFTNVTKQFGEFVDKINALYARVLLWKHGIKSLGDGAAAPAVPILEKHLVATACTDLTNLLFESQLLLGNIQKYDVWDSSQN